MRKQPMKAILFFVSVMLTVCSGSAEAAGHDRSYYEAKGEMIWEYPPADQKVICLTFDDGPDPRNTPEILALLKKYNAKATFFISGNKAALAPELVMQEKLEGHELANHTYSHPNVSRIGVEQLKKEIALTEAEIMKAGGNKPVLFRPPGGYYNERVVQTAKEAGYTVVMWSWHQDTKDWAHPGVPFIVDRVVSNAHSGDIVLFHDYVFTGSQTAAALEKILFRLDQEGYRFITVSELMEIKAAEKNKPFGTKR